MLKFCIFIKDFSFSAKIEVDSHDTIKQVKDKIKKNHSIDVDKQELYLGGLKLEDDKTLTDYKIEKDEQIQLLRNPGSFQIFINNFRGRSISLQVKPSYTIEKVKKLFEDKEGLPVKEQRIIYSGKELEDDRYVSDYSISESNTLHLVSRLRGGAL